MIDIFLDGANLEAMREGRKNPLVRGFTTNPSICRAAGVVNYEVFCKEALEIADGLPISFEVFSDEWDEMERQARIITSWGKNVNVKIPVMNTRGETCEPLLRTLSDDGISCNVTALFTYGQVERMTFGLGAKTPSIISIFAGRIADTGENPEILMKAARNSATKRKDNIKILWASPREVLNIYQAEKCGCHIITVTPDLLAKYEKFRGKDLSEFSLDTVKMFYDDALKSNYQL